MVAVVQEVLLAGVGDDRRPMPTAEEDDGSGS